MSVLRTPVVGHRIEWRCRPAPRITWRTRLGLAAGAMPVEMSLATVKGQTRSSTVNRTDIRRARDYDSLAPLTAHTRKPLMHSAIQERLRRYRSELDDSPGLDSRRSRSQLGQFRLPWLRGRRLRIVIRRCRWW